MGEGRDEGKKGRHRSPPLKKGGLGGFWGDLKEIAHFYKPFPKPKALSLLNREL